jgi:putative DNA-invertase from lambdoid prophage Rac
MTAFAGIAEFERDILRDRLKAGIAQARSESKPHGRPKTAANLVPETQRLRNQG